MYPFNKIPQQIMSHIVCPIAYMHKQHTTLSIHQEINIHAAPPIQPTDAIHSNLITCPNNVPFSFLAQNPAQEHKLPHLTSVLSILNSPQCSPDFHVPESTVLPFCRMALHLYVQTQGPPSWQQYQRCGAGFLPVRHVRSD